MYRYGTALTRPVTDYSETVEFQWCVPYMHTPTVGADRIRPKPRIFDSTRLNGTTHCRGRLSVDPAQSTPKGRFVLRADSIRPYGSSGEAASIQRTALYRKTAGRLIVDPYRVQCNTGTCSVYRTTPPPPHIRSAPPLPGEAWALRAVGIKAPSSAPQ